MDSEFCNIDWELIMKICKYDVFFIFVCFVVLGIFTYYAWQDVDIQFLGFTSGDELPQFRQLNNVLNGFLEFDLEKIFRIEFYNYGYIYYLLNVLITAPFNLLEKYEWAIFAPRFLNGIFSILNLWMVYKISNIYLVKKQSFLLVIFCLLIPGFWHYGYIFKPDVFQAFFVLCSVYFLCLDHFTYKKNFYLSILFLGFGIGIAKFQAIMFAPLLCLYVFAPFFKKLSLKDFWRGCWKSVMVVGCLLLIWIVTNPYVLYPTGAKVWWNMFVLNMLSNATNHGSYNTINLIDKLHMLGKYFLSPLIFVLVLFFYIRCISKKIDKIWTYIFGSFTISLSYLLFFVNKDWGIYYISTIYLTIVLLIPILEQKNNQALVLIVILQICNLFYFHSFDLFAKKSRDKIDIIKMSDEIIDVLRTKTINKKTEVYTDSPNFSFEQIGLTYKNIYQLHGVLLPCLINKEEFQKKYPYKKPNKYFTQFDLIIISKSLRRKNIAMADRDKFEKISLDTIEAMFKYGYSKFAETQHFLFYEYQGDKQ